MDKKRFMDADFEGHLEIKKILPKSFIMECKTTGEEFTIYPCTLGNTTLLCPKCKTKIFFYGDEKELSKQSKRIFIDTVEDRVEYFHNLLEERYVNYSKYNYKEKNNLRGKINYCFRVLKEINPELVDNCDNLQEYLEIYFEDRPELLERKIYKR